MLAICLMLLSYLLRSKLYWHNRPVSTDIASYFNTFPQQIQVLSELKYTIYGPIFQGPWDYINFSNSSFKAYKSLGLLRCIFNDICCPEARKNSITRSTLLAILFIFVETLPII